MAALPQRIIEKIRPSEIAVYNGTPCWEWLASKSEDGYARGQFNGRWVQAARAIYELLVGPIPKGWEPDHLCRNRGCVNPEHLEPVTKRENGLRGEGPHARNARKTHCHRSHEFTPANTIIRRRKGREHRECRKCWKANCLAFYETHREEILAKQKGLR